MLGVHVRGCWAPSLMDNIFTPPEYANAVMGVGASAPLQVPVFPDEELLEVRATAASAEEAVDDDTDADGDEGLLTVLVIGDTQGTMRVESVALGRECNEAERGAVAAALASAAARAAGRPRARPAVLLHLGDAVTWGSDPEDWRAFDALMAPVHAASLSSGLAVMGNHDYFGIRPTAGLALAAARFPHLAARTWYSRRFPLRVPRGRPRDCSEEECGCAGGPPPPPLAVRPAAACCRRFRASSELLVVGLDTNKGHLGAAAWGTQQAWYEEQLSAAHADPRVAAVVVCTHHPPFTNSTLTGDEPHVQTAFLPAFFRCPKTVLFLSGHVHGIERFQKVRARGRARVRACVRALCALTTARGVGGGGGFLLRHWILRSRVHRTALLHVISTPPHHTARAHFCREWRGWRPAAAAPA